MPSLDGRILVVADRAATYSPPLPVLMRAQVIAEWKSAWAAGILQTSVAVNNPLGGSLVTVLSRRVIPSSPPLPWQYRRRREIGCRLNDVVTAPTTGVPRRAAAVLTSDRVVKTSFGQGTSRCR